MIMKLAGARGHASRAGRYSPEQSLTVDCFPSSEPVSARAAMVHFVVITIPTHYLAE
jgi:hypothetical protein